MAGRRKPKGKGRGKDEITVPQALDLAVQHHNAGQLDQAEDIYRQILRIEPNQPDALNLLGVIAHQTGNNDGAHDFLTRSIAANPANAMAHNNMGLVLHGLGREQEALESYAMAIALNNLFADAADAHDNMGISQGALWRVEEAIESHRKAIALNPEHVLAYYNLGNALYSSDRSQEAIDCYNQAIRRHPEFSQAHKNLAAAQKDLGQRQEALTSYRRSLALTPNDHQVHTNMGTILQDLGRLDEAVDSYRLANTLISSAKLLECLFALGRRDEFDQQRQKLITAQDSNIRGAAISAYAAQQWGTPDPFPFCPSPLDFVEVFERGDGIAIADDFIAALIDELTAQAIIWQPKGIATTKGYQTLNSLFDKPQGKIAELGDIFRDRIGRYHQRRASADNRFVQCWTDQPTLKGWFVRLQQGGFQDSHIHPDGWLSGVIYLHMPKAIKAQEGAIEFGLWGFDYPVLKDYPTRVITPQVGQVVLFPSSLFHRTIPFSSDEERLVVAFDLIPDWDLSR